MGLISPNGDGKLEPSTGMGALPALPLSPSPAPASCCHIGSWPDSLPGLTASQPRGGWGGEAPIYDPGSRHRLPRVSAGKDPSHSHHHRDLQMVVGTLGSLAPLQGKVKRAPITQVISTGWATVHITSANPYLSLRVCGGYRRGKTQRSEKLHNLSKVIHRAGSGSGAWGLAFLVPFPSGGSLEQLVWGLFPLHFRGSSHWTFLDPSSWCLLLSLEVGQTHMLLLQK